MKGCVLFGRFRWADESKNRPRSPSAAVGSDRDDSPDAPDDNTEDRAR